eukprot:1982929-Pyramimonas_sp.AAC.1
MLSIFARNSGCRRAREPYAQKTIQKHKQRSAVASRRGLKSLGLKNYAFSGFFRHNIWSGSSSSPLA